MGILNPLAETLELFFAWMLWPEGIVGLGPNVALYLDMPRWPSFCGELRYHAHRRWPLWLERYIRSRRSERILHSPQVSAPVPVRSCEAWNLFTTWWKAALVPARSCEAWNWFETWWKARCFPRQLVSGLSGLVVFWIVKANGGIVFRRMKPIFVRGWRFVRIRLLETIQTGVLVGHWFESGYSTIGLFGWHVLLNHL